MRAPVDTVLSSELRTPGVGTGIYDREGGLKTGQKRTYDVTLTRTSGPDRPVTHTLRLKNNAGRTFSILGPQLVTLPLNQPVTVRVQAAPSSVGIKSAILEADDPRTPGTDKLVLATVAVSTPAHYTFAVSDSVERNGYRTYLVTVPEGAKALQVRLSGMKEPNWMSLTTQDPTGLPKDGTLGEFTAATFADPRPGVWEFAVQAYWGTKDFDNPYDLDATVLGATFAPDPVTVREAGGGTPAPVSWKVTNTYAPLSGTLRGGPLGSSKTARPTIADGESQTTTVEVPEGATSLDVAIGGASDPAAVLDLTVYDAEGNVVGQSADGGSDQSISVAEPAPGTYTIQVDGYWVPKGSTTYDYRDTFFSTGLGSVTADDSTPVQLGTGDSVKVSARVTAAAAGPAGRELFGQVRLVNDQGTVVGAGTVRIEKVTP